MNRRTFLINALSLTASAFLMRAVNIAYRIYLTDKIGAEGMGLYQLIYSVFVFAITVSTAGISLSVTRIISEAITGRKQHTIKNCVHKCCLFSLCLSMGAAMLLLLASGWIGSVVLEDARVILPLRILALGLPFMAVCACMKGYFLAVRGVIRTTIGELLEQFVSIAVPAALFSVFAPSSVELCCCAVMIGSTAGEAASCLTTYLLYRLHIRRMKHSSYEKCSGIFRQLCRISLPITASAALRSGLGVIENLLIPIGYRKNGVSAASALAEYGILNGMVMPVLFFPSTFLSAFASLLVPEMTEALTLQHHRTIQSIAGRAVRFALLFSIFVSVFIGCFAKHIGLLLYQNTESVRLMQILAPLIPLWYLDMIVDNLLKGLDQQMASMRYNFYDTAIRVVLVYFLIPLAGTKGYLVILFFSTIFNAVLSLHRLIKTSPLRIPVFRCIAAPVFIAMFSVSVCQLLISSIPVLGDSLWAVSLCALFCSAAMYCCILYLSGILKKESFLLFHRKGAKRGSPEGLPHSETI